MILERKCNFVITINNNIQFYVKGGHVLNRFTHFFCLPFIAIKNRKDENDDDEINKMKEIIRRRVSKDLIDENALELAVLYSGGSISTLFKIYSVAINKTSVSNECKISVEFIEKAFFEVRFRDAYFGYDKLDELRIIHRSNTDIDNKYKKLPTTELKNYLYNCTLLTYRDLENNSKERYVLNPSFHYDDDLKEMVEKYKKE